MKANRSLACQKVSKSACVAVSMLIAFSMASEKTTADTSHLHKCTAKVSRQADSSLNDASHDWEALLEHQKAFGFCDDGSLAEGYFEAVVNLLSQH